MTLHDTIFRLQTQLFSLSDSILQPEQPFAISNKLTLTIPSIFSYDMLKTQYAYLDDFPWVSITHSTQPITPHNSEPHEKRTTVNSSHWSSFSANSVISLEPQLLGNGFIPYFIMLNCPWHMWQQSYILVSVLKTILSTQIWRVVRNLIKYSRNNGL